MRHSFVSAVVVWVALGAWQGCPRTALAQRCDEDAASACFDDAGTENDAGPVGGVVHHGADAGADAAARAGTEACSCTTNDSEELDTSDSPGRVHVCTGSLDPEVCEDLDCERGIFEKRACDSSSVRYCCEMPNGLYSQLYENCDHPRCEQGFVAQCEDFGGTLLPRACDVPDDVKETDDGGGFCSAVPGRTSPASAALLVLVGLALGVRRRRR